MGIFLFTYSRVRSNLLRCGTFRVDKFPLSLLISIWVLTELSKHFVTERGMFVNLIQFLFIIVEFGYVAFPRI